MPKAELARVEEIADDVFALSNLVDLASPRTWVDPTATGYDPSNSYLIRDGGEALLIDTGFRAHGDLLAAQIESLLPADASLHVVTTRIEPDALGNIDRLVERFRVARVLGQTNVKPLDYIGPLSHGYPELVFDNGLRPGDTFSFGDDRTIDVVEPAVRTLPTMWLWDATSETLFTSDSFGGLYVDDPGNWDGQALEDAGRLERHVLAKFDWLAIADTTLAVERLDRAAALDPAALCPGHGRWTVGRAAVRARVDLLRRALQSIPSRHHNRASYAGARDKS